MTKRYPRPHELKIIEKLRREEPDAPVSVIEAEARHRFEAEVLRLAIEGVSQVTLAKRFRYSIATVSRIVKAATLREEADVGSPLSAWIATAAAHEPAPAPEDAIETEVWDVDRTYRKDDEVVIGTAHFRCTAPEVKGHMWTLKQGVMVLKGWEAIAPEVNAVTVGVDTQPPMTAIAVGWNGEDGSRSWILRLDGNDLSLSGVPPTPEPYIPTDADRALFATIQDRGPLLGAAIRMVQLAAGIPATGDVDDETMSVVAGLAVWQARPRPLLDDVERFMSARRGD